MVFLCFPLLNDDFPPRYKASQISMAHQLPEDFTMARRRREPRRFQRLFFSWKNLWLVTSQMWSQDVAKPPSLLIDINGGYVSMFLRKKTPVVDQGFLIRVTFPRKTLMVRLGLGFSQDFFKGLETMIFNKKIRRSTTSSLPKHVGFGPRKRGSTNKTFRINLHHTSFV